MCFFDERHFVAKLGPMGNIMSKILGYLNNEDGASAAEYALILAIVGAAIAAAAIFLGQTIASAVNSAASCISSKGTSGC